MSNSLLIPSSSHLTFLKRLQWFRSGWADIAEFLCPVLTVTRYHSLPLENVLRPEEEIPCQRHINVFLPEILTLRSHVIRSGVHAPCSLRAGSVPVAEPHHALSGPPGVCSHIGSSVRAICSQWAHADRRAEPFNYSDAKLTGIIEKIRFTYMIRWHRIIKET